MRVMDSMAYLSLPFQMKPDGLGVSLQMGWDGSMFQFRLEQAVKQLHHGS